MSVSSAVFLSCTLGTYFIGGHADLEFVDLGMRVPNTGHRIAPRETPISGIIEWRLDFFSAARSRSDDTQ